MGFSQELGTTHAKDGRGGGAIMQMFEKTTLASITTFDLVGTTEGG